MAKTLEEIRAKKVAQVQRKITALSAKIQKLDARKVNAEAKREALVYLPLSPRQTQAAKQVKLDKFTAKIARYLVLQSEAVTKLVALQIELAAL